MKKQKYHCGEQSDETISISYRISSNIVWSVERLAYSDSVSIISYHIKIKGDLR
jgi:hypothetical protein